MKLACLLLAFAAASQGQSAEERGKKLIDSAVQALGGRNFLAMADRVEAGRAYSFYREQLSGLSIAKIYTRYVVVAAGKSGEELGVRERQAFGKNEDSSVLFLENGGWDINWRGAKDLPQDRLDRYRDTTLRNIFYILRQRLHEPGMIFESRGSDVWENQPVNIVDITDSQDRLVTVYLHQDTNLPVMEKYSWRDEKTRERNDEQTRFARYRDVGGVQWPYQITRERNGEKVYQMFSDSVMVNQDLTDNVFAVAASGKKK